MIGWRARLGVLVPALNTTVEPEWNRAVPDGVTIHAARLAVKGAALSAAALSGMADDIEPAVAALQMTDVLGYACTSGSFLNGPAWDARLIERMRQASGKPATTTSTSVVAALRALGVSRVAVATPYTDDINDRLVAFLGDCGIEVVKIAGLGTTALGGSGNYPAYASYRLAREVDRPEAEALLISCTNFGTFAIIDRLERDAGKPVVSACQATLWMSLRLAGIRDALPELGRLMSLEPLPEPATACA